MPSVEGVSYVENLLDMPQKDIIFTNRLQDGVSTLPVGSSFTFKGYAGQGFVLVDPHNARGVRLFVNGVELDVSSALIQNRLFEVDIASYTSNGKNTIQVNGLYTPDAFVRVQVPWPTIIDGVQASKLSQSLPSLDRQLLALDTVLECDIAHGFPGAQLCIVKDGQLVVSRAYGYLNSYTAEGRRLSPSERMPINEDTLFDLASMTKMFATNMALQKLVYEGRISVEDKVVDYLPAFRDPASASNRGKGSLTIRQVLEHQAGFQPDTRFFDEGFDDIEGAKPGVNPLYARTKEDTYKRICNDLPLSYAPGTDTRYSDTDYMILGFIVETVTGQTLDAYVEHEIYSPLGLDRIVFNPLKKGFASSDTAATELDGNAFGGTVTFTGMRSGTLQGEVHDPKAWYCMNGVSGHAGLFGTARQIAALCQVMLNGGGYGNITLFDKNTCNEFIKPKASNPTFGLGWRRQADDGYSNFFGNQGSLWAFGHTGWTGTLAFIDPLTDLIVVYLTNKLNTPMADARNVIFGGTRYLSGQLGMAPFFACSAMDDGSQGLTALFCSMLHYKHELYTRDENHHTPIDKEVILSLADMLRAVSAYGNERDRLDTTAVLQSILIHDSE